MPYHVPETAKEIGDTATKSSSEAFRKVPRIKQTTRIRYIGWVIPYIAIEVAVIGSEPQRILAGPASVCRIVVPATKLIVARKRIICTACV